jgi:hypothetical protein
MCGAIHPLPSTPSYLMCNLLDLKLILRCKFPYIFLLLLLLPIKFWASMTRSDFKIDEHSLSLLISIKTGD